jgi:hypothetical protein
MMTFENYMILGRGASKGRYASGHKIVRYNRVAGIGVFMLVVA